MPRDAANLAFVTQTTLSVDDTAEIVGALKERFPAISVPHKEDICYATTNRQEAVKDISAVCDLVLVIGSAKSSNSQRLVEVALRAGARAAYLIDDAGGVDWTWFEDVHTLGITAGASAPEDLIGRPGQGRVRALRRRSHRKLGRTRNRHVQAPPRPDGSVGFYPQMDTDFRGRFTLPLSP